MGYRFENGVFKGTCSESTFAAHLAWRDWGAPDASAYNLFGSAILKSSDGALLYGVMSDHTATAGMIYPPGGNLDPTDLTPEGKVDMIGAIYRELEEETGLTKDELRADRLLVAFDGPRIAIAQVFDTGRNAAELRENIIRFFGKLRRAGTGGCAHHQKPRGPEGPGHRALRPCDRRRAPALNHTISGACRRRCFVR
ncbi:NUDIX hydrolase [Roseibium salinum]|nr:NUDIX hydrolase [Roseibium salinum]